MAQNSGVWEIDRSRVEFAQMSIEVCEGSKAYAVEGFTTPRPPNDLDGCKFDVVDRALQIHAGGYSCRSALPDFESMVGKRGSVDAELDVTTGGAGEAGLQVRYCCFDSDQMEIQHDFLCERGRCWIGRREQSPDDSRKHHYLQSKAADVRQDKRFSMRATVETTEPEHVRLRLFVDNVLVVETTDVVLHRDDYDRSHGITLVPSLSLFALFESRDESSAVFDNLVISAPR